MSADPLLTPAPVRISVPRITFGPGVSGDWVQEQVQWLYGFRLIDFQLEDMIKQLNGGVFAFLYPTDYGKSMSIEIGTVLDLIRDPTCRTGVIKINDDAARETAAELAMRLHKAAVKYPAVEPMISWRGELPHNVGKGFWVKGALATALEGRNTNRSVRCYGLGSRDLQGKRFRTRIDDIVTEQEARSQAHRDTIDARLDLVLRTLEAEGLEKNGLWAMFGTPQYEGSPYERIPMALRDAGIAHEVVRRPLYRPDGTPLMPSRVQKSEVHRATMSRSAFAAAYDLKPYGYKKPTLEQIETLIKHRGMPVPTSKAHFIEWLFDELSRRYSSVDKAKQLLTRLEFFVGWDPAESGDCAQSTIAKLDRHVWVLRSQLNGGITSFEQSTVIGRMVDDFPESIVVMENNATQKAFRDVHEFRRPDDMVIEHGTYRNKNHGPISMPSMVQSMVEGYFHVPWQDEEASELAFGDLIDEIKKYSVASHPHILPAIWFGWYYSEKSAGRTEADAANELPAGVTPEFVIQQPRMPVLMPITISALVEVEDELKKRSREAWSRVREPYR